MNIECTTNEDGKMVGKTKEERRIKERGKIKVVKIRG